MRGKKGVFTGILNVEFLSNMVYRQSTSWRKYETVYRSVNVLERVRNLERTTNVSNLCN